ncbi:beta strand repeat-containing protein [Phragmitibacter flavus]|uniref:beta strand repeat-containing protein n=1 Tax=Phragmitibacter flavus TaxID=2576071 RepID=UPI00197F354F|nr:right-handed parallel beta-helix repeat-containing protein [Phragmitibacter flavus]
MIAGYYSFDNQPFGPQRGGSGNTEGWKLGIEVRPVPALVLTATWYDDEGLTGSDWVAGVGLQIPLGKDWKDAFKSRRRHLAERLAEPVARQNAAIKTSRSVDVDQEVSQTSSTRTAVVRRVVSEGQGRITIKEDIVFVNNGGDVGNGIQTGSDITGDGTAEQPFETIQKGADLAATNHVDNQKTWTVYTQGAGAHGGIGYGESVSIGSSTAFISSATSIVSPIGGSFGTGDRPTVFGGFAGDASLFVAGSSPSTFVGISGYEIQGGYDDDSMSPPHPSVVAQAAGDGIHLRDVDRVEIVDNIIAEAEDDGVQLYHQDVLEALFEDNRIVDTVDENGIEIDTYGSDINFMSFVNNTITGNGDDGVDLDIEGGLNGWFVDNNVSDNGANGINVGVGRDLIANIVGNTVSDNEDDGFYSFVGGDFIGSVVENSASNNGASGLNFEVLGSMTAGVIGNVADSNDRAGIQVLANQFTGSMAFNEVTNSDFTVGMLVYLTGNYTGDFVNNSGLNNYAGSFLLTLGSDGDFIGNLSYNSATGDDVGISLSMDALNLYGNVVGNNMSNNGSTGIGLSLGERFHGDLSDNVVTGNGAGGGQGIVVSAADFKGNVINNDTSDNAFRGLSITIFDGGGMLSGDFEGNVIGNRSNNILSGDGIGIVAQGSFKGDVVSNIANGNRVGGISVLSFDGIEGNFSMNQTLDNSDSVGLVINTGGNGITGNITQNTSTGNGIAGFFLTANVGSNFVGSFSDNIANNNNTQNINGGGGIVVNIDGMWAGDTQNNVSNNNLGVGFRINVSGGFTGTASGNSSNLNDVGFSTGAILGLGAGAVTGPNTATGNTVFDFESPAGSAILTPLP